VQQSVVVVGAGHAGVAAAAALAAGGLKDCVTLLDRDDPQPYHRPPLSKEFLADKVNEAALGLKATDFYGEQGIRLQLGATVRKICRVEQRLELASGKALSYDRLILATGTRNRELHVAGADSRGVCYLRSLSDARALRKALPELTHVVVVGGGFIGLEFSALARRLGIHVVVIEAGDRIMARAVSPITSTFFLHAHESWGSKLLFGDTVASIETKEGAARSIVTAAGRSIKTDMVLVGIGVIPNDELARDAGLAVDNGIIVDAHMRTSDPNIYAIGDCSNHPSRFARTRHRLESVQNANDQARCAATNILGRPATYQSVPWFWSDQGPHKLQIAGVAEQSIQDVSVGDPNGPRFSVLRFQGGLLRAVDSVNDTSCHMAARRLLQSDAQLTIDHAIVPEFDLKSWVKSNA
jgi:3-phenylpropionate/trans-cinnamate dioxygenase ferredoxin reductase component